MAAEYSTSPPAPACATCYLTADHLGSTRLVTDSSGNVIGRYDYLPSGEEIPADSAVRTPLRGYASGPDGFNPKFTGQVRDTETGLDYFNARYYDPAQGRFVSSDPENAGASMSDSQTWNGYAYVTNNPLEYTDPSGLQSINDNGTPPNGWIWSVTYNPSNPNNPFGPSGWVLAPYPFFYYGGPALRAGNSKPPDVSSQSDFFIRRKSQTYMQCMEEHASDYSLAGFIDNGAGAMGFINVNLSHNFWGSVLLGNNITGGYFAIFGSTEDSFTGGKATMVNRSLFKVIPTAIGTGLTAQRRTASIVSMNLKGARGPAIQVLARSAGLRSALGLISHLEGLLLADAGLVIAEATNCAGHQ